MVESEPAAQLPRIGSFEVEEVIAPVGLAVVGLLLVVFRRPLGEYFARGQRQTWGFGPGRLQGRQEFGVAAVGVSFIVFAAVGWFKL